MENENVGISLIEDSLSENKTDKNIGDFNYERSEIPIELIEECDSLYESTGDTYFIFDNDISNSIESRKSFSKMHKRDIELDKILEVKYHVGAEDNFNSLPSRFSYYDTETKLTCRYKRYNYVVDFLIRLGFEPSISNVGPEFEQSYIFEYKSTGDEDWFHHKFIVRLKPNLFLSIDHQYSDSTEGFKMSMFNGFFSKGKILDTLSKSTKGNLDHLIRDIKLDHFTD